MKRLYRIFRLGGRLLPSPRLSPASSGPFGNRFHGAIANDALLVVLGSGVALRIGKFILALDQKPVLSLGIAGSFAAQAYEMPAALKPFAMEIESQVAALKIAFGISKRLPCALVPEHDGPAAILALRDGTLERPVVEGMIFNMNREAFVFRVEAWALCHCPAFQNAIEFEPKIVMQARCGMLLNKVPLTSRTSALGTRRFACFPKVAFCAILIELGVRRRH